MQIAQYQLFCEPKPMKCVILAGGKGTRIAEESGTRPKPMLEIGGRPILWHIMKLYAAFGVNEFIVCLGYKGYMIKEYFANYFLHQADVTFDMSAQPRRVPRLPQRAVESHPGGHRRGEHDRRAGCCRWRSTWITAARSA